MIVDDGEGVDFLASDFERAFEVALPEVVGCGTLEADRIVSGRCGSSDAAIAAEDVGDSA